MKYALHTGMWCAGLLGMVAAHFSDWRSAAEACSVMAGCMAALVIGYDYGKDARFRAEVYPFHEEVYPAVYPAGRQPWTPSSRPRPPSP